MGSATESLQGMYVKGGSFLKNSEEYVFDKIAKTKKVLKVLKSFLKYKV
jgi:hypothetical protein